MENNMETAQFGLHFMLDGYGANPKRLRDKEALLELLNTLPTSIGMYPISQPLVVEVGPNNKKDPGGISGFVMIAESHISVHTFPNRGFVTIDTYTCQNELNTEALAKSFCDHFEVSEQDIQVIKRGTKYPVDDIV